MSPIFYSLDVLWLVVLVEQEVNVVCFVEQCCESFHISLILLMIQDYNVVIFQDIKTKLPGHHKAVGSLHYSEHCEVRQYRAQCILYSIVENGKYGEFNIIESLRSFQYKQINVDAN